MGIQKRKSSIEYSGSSLSFQSIYPSSIFYLPYHSVFLWFVVCSLSLFTSCATSRDHLVWTEDGRQYGKASWYDDQGDRTANGEIYNMNAMTAAHPSLALNSVVEVKNLSNGKKVKVRVNDRLPPIHDGRVIDLSRAAFRTLASLETGLIDVELHVIKYGDNKYDEINRAAPAGKMYLPKPKSTKSSKSEMKTNKSL